MVYKKISTVKVYVSCLDAYIPCLELMYDNPWGWVWTKLIIFNSSVYSLHLDMMIMKYIANYINISSWIMENIENIVNALYT